MDMYQKNDKQNAENKTSIQTSSINWYPGHMAKAIREIEEKLKLVDLVIVLLDARIPYSSFNPLLKEKLQNKKVLYILTKKDMADNSETNKFIDYYQKKDSKAIAINSKEPKYAKIVLTKIQEMMAEKRLKDKAKGLKPRPIRTMVVGIPNVGKSTFINALVKKRATNVGDKPGVTKVQQWIRIHNEVELLDTPGVLWPKFEEEKIGYRLAIVGSIKDDILKMEDVCNFALDYILKYYKDEFLSRYNLTNDININDIINCIGKDKKYYLNNGYIDTERVAKMIIQDIRNVNISKITFEKVEEYANK